MNYNLKTIKTSMQSETQREKRKMYNNLLPAIGQILPGFFANRHLNEGRCRAAASI